MPVMRIAALDSVNHPGVSYRLTVYRPSDGLYLDFDDATFKAFVAVVTSYQALLEVAEAPGVWEVDWMIEAGTTDIVELYVHQTPTTELHSVRSVAFSAGEPLVDLVRPEVLLGTHFRSFGAYQVVDTSGTAVQDAVVRVYVADDYNADAESAVPVGMTTTDADGYWLAPVPVSAGQTYVIHVHKPAVVGPVATTVTV